jgi:hypothetical protein
MAEEQPVDADRVAGVAVDGDVEAAARPRWVQLARDGFDTGARPAVISAPPSSGRRAGSAPARALIAGERR